ncbi:MAG TPA: tetratricopeptide repeat protein [Oligoflexus sp.]|uniref:tetratricopeptide repeat protein n=1 Tax=Oligoflexus sp. TaxID=1971216 RepID=UPI002D4AF82F|nr:tetratricopeptide repeat protein [Oligoflexus sp.]HYX34691.1 tetratricopeptide repeat protein [Oligoflexus sp.]
MTLLLLKRLFFLLLFGGGWWDEAWAERRVKSFRPDLTHEEFFLLGLDDPTGLLVQSRAELQKRAGATRDIVWARLLAAQLHTEWELSEIDNDYFQAPLIEEARAIALKSGDKWLELRLAHLQEGLLLKQVHIRPVDVEAALVIAEARAQRMGGGLFLVDTWREYANFFSFAQSHKRALELDHKALELIRREGNQDDDLRALIHNDTGIVLAELQQHVQAREMYKEVLAFCRRMKLRHLGAVVSHNLARIYVKSSDSTEWDLAAELFQESIRTSAAVGEKLVLGYSTFGLADLRVVQKRWNEALEQYQQSEQAFESIQGDDLATHTLRADVNEARARIFLELDRWDEALVQINRAIQLYPGTMVGEQAAAYRTLARIQNKRRDHEAAYNALHRFTVMFERIQEEKKQQSLDKLQVSLGLQVEEQRNNLLSKENELQAQKLRSVEMQKRVGMSLLLFSILVIGFLASFLRQARLIKKTRREMQRVLDNIEEGILTIGRDLQVDTNFSPYLANLLQLSANDLHRRDLFLLLLQRSDLTPDQQATIKSSLEASIGEAPLTWELNVGQLPHELVVDQRVIALHWQPLLDRHEVIVQILVSLRDHTARRQLEIQLHQKSERSHHLVSQLRDILQADVRRVKQLMQEMEGALPILAVELRQSLWIRKNFRILHTWKGVARTLGLKPLAAAIHSVEEVLDAMHDRVRDSEVLDISLTQLTNEVGMYSELILQMSQLGGAAILPERVMNLHEIVGEIKTHVQKQLQVVGLSLDEVQVIDGISTWTSALSRSVQEVLSHGLSNSIDHGFIRPLQEGRTVRPIRLFISAHATNNRLQLRIRDNGVGLDRARLEELARRHAFHPKSEAELSDILFLDGVTTADVATQSSGRGVGLSAIRSLCTELQGEAHIHPTSDVGTELEVEWPLTG